MINVYLLDPRGTQCIPWDMNSGRSLVDTVYHENVIGVGELYADGEELDLIRELFRNLPLCHDAKELVWYGDHAKFIVANLP